MSGDSVLRSKWIAEFRQRALRVSLPREDRKCVALARGAAETARGLRSGLGYGRRRCDPDYAYSVSAFTLAAPDFFC